MAANISMAGNKVIDTNSPSPIKPETTLSIKAVDMNTTVHIKPNTKKARQLRKHATVLKNKLLIAGTPCQCTNAGACQNTIDKGM